MMKDSTDVAGIPLPPPFIPTAVFLAGAVVQAVLPAGAGPNVRVSWLGWALLGLGILLIGAAFTSLARAGTPVDPGHPVTALVVVGPYRYLRNPIYAGFCFGYLGVCLILGLWVCLLLAPLVPIALTAIVISREEAYLERRFGDEYRGYRARVRRWGIL